MSQSLCSLWHLRAHRPQRKLVDSVRTHRLATGGPLAGRARLGRLLLGVESLEDRRLLAGLPVGEPVGYSVEFEEAITTTGWTDTATAEYSRVSLSQSGLQPRVQLFKPDDISAYLVNQMLVAQQRSLADGGFADGGFDAVVDEVWSRYQPNRITVKFLDDSGIRAIDGNLVDTGMRGTRFAEVYARHNGPLLNEAGEAVEERFSQTLLDESVQAVLSQLGDAEWVSTTKLSDEAMAKLLVRGEANTGKAMPDLRTQIELHLPEDIAPAFAVDLLNELPFVELAQPLSIPAPPPTPGDYTGEQTYADNAPDGIGVDYFRDTFENRGAGISIVDIEYAFNPHHMDLPDVTILQGSIPSGDTTPDSCPAWNQTREWCFAQHGTAVLGIMAGVDNGFGVTGLADEADYFFSSQYEIDLTGAMDDVFVGYANEVFRPGDVVLYEAQIWGPVPNIPSISSQHGMVPVEWRTDIYQQIEVAVAVGLIVVEAAANGWQNLDSAIYNCDTCNFGHHPFERENDSGAIIVGAGGTDRTRLDFSNFGSRVDLQGWGTGIVTTGYGDRYDSGGDNLLYRISFNGTSGASPFVASAVTLLNSLRMDYNFDPFAPLQVRELLVGTGQPQQGNPTFPVTQNIGPLPDLEAATLSLGYGRTLVTLEPNGVLLLNDQVGKDDSLVLSRSGNSLVIHDATSLIHTHVGTGSGTHTVTIPFSAFNSISVDTRGGIDQLTLNLQFGDVIPNGGLHFNAGGDQGDTLRLVGGSQGQVIYTTSSVDSGSISLGNFGEVTFAGLASSDVTHYPIRNEGQSFSSEFQVMPVGVGATPHRVHHEGLESTTLIGFSGPGVINTAFLNSSNSLAITPAVADELAVEFHTTPLSSSLLVGSAAMPVRHFSVMESMGLAPNRDLMVHASRSIAVNASVLASSSGDIVFHSGQTINLAASLTTSTGNIHLSAPGTNALPGVAVFGGVSVTSSSGNISIETNSLLVAPTASITASTGSVSITTHSPDVDIVLGGDDVLTPGVEVLGLSTVELSRINTPNLSVGNVDTGPITVLTALTAFPSISITSGATVSIQQPISGSQATVRATGNGAEHALTLAGNGQLTMSTAVTIVADSYRDISTAATGISAGTGLVTMEPLTAGTEIDLGGSDLLSGAFLKLGIGSDELTRIQAGTLRLGRNNNGATNGPTGHIRVTSPVELRDQGIETLELRSAAFVGGPTAAAIDVPNLFVYSVLGIQLQGDNDVDVLAMHSAGTGHARFTDVDGFQVGTVAGFNGVTALNQTIELRSNIGTIHVAAPIITDNSGSITVHAGQSIDVAANVIATSGGISLTAEGLAPLNTIGVRVREGAAVATIGGPVVVSGKGSMGTAGSRDGVRVTGASSQISSIGGAVTVTGVGGSGTQGSHYGVRVHNGGEINSQGMGTLAVTGTGGAASGTFNFGVYVGGNDAKLRTVGGQLTVEANGGGVTASGSNRGLWVDLGGSITTTSGPLNVTGTGGIGNGGFNRGVYVEHITALVGSTSGNVTVTGYGGGSGSSANDIGVHVDKGGRITTGGTGSMRIEGHGGVGTGVSQFGVRIQNADSNIHHAGLASDPASSGSVEVVGYGTANSAAVLIETENAVTAAHGADITISADSLNLTESPQGTINAGTGVLTLQTATLGTPIDIGGNDQLSNDSPVLGLSLTELGRVTAGVLRIGRNDALASGPIDVTGPLTSSTIPQTAHFRSGSSVTSMNAIGINNLAISAATGITLDATNALETIALSNSVSGTVFVRDFEDLTIGTVDQVAGITSVASSTTVTLENGFLNVQSPIDTSLGDNPLTLFAGQAIALVVPPGGLGGHITGGAGSITLTGNGQKPLTGGTGVSVNGVNVTTIGNGDITIVGKGGSGTGSANDGVRVGNNSLVRPGGSGDLSITGTAGGGSFSSGVFVTGASARVDSMSGDVTVIGSGHNLGIGTNRGVWVNLGGVIASGGSVTVEGTAGTGSPTSQHNQGVYVVHAGSRITADDSVTVRATGSSHAEALRLESAGRIDSDGFFRTISIQADSIVITGATPGGIGTPDKLVRISPLTNGTLINLGGADVLTGSPRTLGLTDAELDNVVGSLVEIGNSNSGALTVSSPISHGNHLLVQSGGTIAINSTLTLVNDKNLRVVTTDRITQTGITVTGGIANTTYEAARNIDIANHVYAGSGGITLDAFGTVSGSYKGLRIHSGANVSASGSGPVTLRGRGGSTAILSHGVEVTGAGTVVESVNGTLTIVGDGVSTGVLTHGLLVDQGAIIRSTGSGEVSVTGNAGPGGNSNGVRVTNSAEIRSTSANVTVFATGGANSQALELALNGRLLAGGSSTLTVIADSISLVSGGVLNAQTGALEVYPRTSTTPIDLGGPDVLTAGSKVLGISSDELGSMFGSVVRIGSRDTTPSGPITISQPIEPANFSTLHLRSGSSVSGSNAVIVGWLAVSASTGIDLQAGNFLGTVALHNNVSGAVSLREVDGVAVGTVDGVIGALADGPLNPLTLTVDAGGFGGVSAVNSIRAFGPDGSVTITAPRVLVRALVSGGEQGTNITATGDIDFNVSGVRVENGGTITATGDGPVSVQGTGGNDGSSGSNAGVWVFGSGSQITSSGGPLTIVGQGGSSTGPLNHGVRVSFGGTITTATPGTITVTGTGGINSPGAFGVLVDNLDSRIAAAGSLTVSGSGVAGGVVLRDRGALVSVSASPLTVTTDSLLINGPDADSFGSIDATGAIVRIAPQTEGTLLNLGGDDVLSGSPKTLGLSSAELDRITASTLVLGDTATGPVTVSQPIAPINVTNLEVVGGTSINVNAPITMGPSGLLAVDAHQNLRVAADITAGSGGLQLTGRGNQAINSDGVVTTSGAMIKAVNNGDISIVGSGGMGAGAGNYGVGIGNSQVVTVGSGSIHIAGYGASVANSNHYGLWIGSNGIVETQSGDISLFGQGGGGAGTGSGNYGIIFSGSAARVSAGGTGDISIQGNGGIGTSSGGAFLAGLINTVDGDIALQGTGGSVGTNSHGLFLSTNANIAANGDGTVDVVATCNDLSTALRLDNNGVLQTADQTITVRADSVQFGGTTLGRIDAGSGIVAIEPVTPGTELRIGGADVLGSSTRALGLTSAELDRITAGELHLGNIDTGRVFNSTLHTFAHDQVVIRNGNADMEAIGGWSFAGDLFVESGGSIYQGNNELTVAGLADFRAAGDITLDGQGDPNGNEFNDVRVVGNNIVIYEDHVGFNLVGAEIGTHLTLFTSNPITQSGVLSGPGGLTVAGNGSLLLDQVNTYTGLTEVQGDSTLSIDGEVAGDVRLTPGTTLTGSGLIGGGLFGVGDIRPGSNLGQDKGILRISGSSSFVGSVFLEVDGGTAGFGYDQLIFDQPIDLSGVNAFIDGLAGFAWQFPVEIITNMSASPTVPFANLAEGSVVTIDGIDSTITYLGGDGNDVVLTQASDVVPPTVQLAVASSSFWSAGFIDAVDGDGVGAGNGYGIALVPGGPTIKQDNVDSLLIQFSEAVTNVHSSSIEVRNSFGVVPSTVSYDAATFVATISFGSSLPFGKYRLGVADTVTDLVGNALDGDLSGAAGGIFDVRFDVLPGDANGDQRVNGSDLSIFSGAFNSQLGQSRYSPDVDWNADGRVNGSDLAVFSANFNRQLGSLSDPDVPFTGGQGNGRARLHDYFFDGFASNSNYHDDEEEEKKDETDWQG